MGDRIIQEHISLDTGQVGIHELEGAHQEQIVDHADVDPEQAAHELRIERTTRRLFNKFVGLENQINPQQRQSLILEIESIFNLRQQYINPQYIDFVYAERHGENAASLFAIVDSLDIPSSLKSQWHMRLSLILVSDIIISLRQEFDFDQELVLNHLVKYNQESEMLDNAVKLITGELYTFEFLKWCMAQYNMSIETLMVPEVMNALEERVIEVEDIFKLRSKYLPSDFEIDTANYITSEILSDQNIAYLNTEQGSKTIFSKVINAVWPRDFSLHRNIQDPEFFKLLNSSVIEDLMNRRLVTIELLVLLSKEDLTNIINARGLSDICGAINIAMTNHSFVRSSQTSVSSSSASSSSSAIISGQGQVAQQQMTTTNEAAIEQDAKRMRVGRGEE